MAADYPFSFTTDAAPVVTSTTPVDGATDVDPSANIVIDFSEPVTVSNQTPNKSFDILCGEFTHPGYTASGSGTSTITITLRSAASAQRRDLHGHRHRGQRERH